MRIEQLEYATAVARSGSFRQAAKELHISQPALSENVRKLERELGVDILDRRRSGARIGAGGRELLPHMLAVIEAVDNLRQAADEAHRATRTIQVGTVGAATMPILAPTVRAFRETHPHTEVEILNSLQTSMRRALLEGSMDLGLVHYLEGDDLPTDLDAVELMRARPVVWMRSDSPLTERTSITSEELGRQPLIAMRSGYLMRRLLHRVLGTGEPNFAYSADGAELAKAMVGAGLGVAIMPEYSVAGYPPERDDEITHRPLAEDQTEILLVIHRRRSKPANDAVSELHQLLVEQARLLAEDGSPRRLAS